MLLRERIRPSIRKRALDLGVYGHSAYAPFLVLGRSRVGSNLLRGLLNAHPQIETFGEIFRDTSCMDWDHIGYFQTRAMQPALVQDPVRFVADKVFGRYPRRIGAVGFKLFYYHAREGAAASIWPYLRDRSELKIIHLKRRNLLATHLSRKRAAVTNRWVNTTGRPDEPLVLSLDFDECLNDFVQTRAWEEEGDRYFAGHPRLEVVYERLATDHGAEVQALQAFLEVPAQPARPTTFKQVAQPLSAMIANYAELKARFKGTVWEEFFDD